MLIKQQVLRASRLLAYQCNLDLSRYFT